MLYLLLNEYSKAFIIVAFTEKLRYKYFFLYFIYKFICLFICIHFSSQKICDMENCRRKRSEKKKIQGK